MKQPNNGHLFIFLFFAVLFAASSTFAQTTYWMGRRVGDTYKFDQKLPEDFGQMLTASLPKYRNFINFPQKKVEVIDGERVEVMTTEIGWDRDTITDGNFAYAKDGYVQQASWWINIDGKSDEWKALVPIIKSMNKQDGAWKNVRVPFVVRQGDAPPTFSIPVPELELAKERLFAVHEKTAPGMFYPSVNIPADLNALRQAMLDYGNLGRRDPGFRKTHGSKTVTDLSPDKVRTLGGMEKVYKNNQTPPYFHDHQLSDELNRAAQFQAEYQAYIDSMTHDGPRSFRDPTTGKTGDLSTLSKRGDFFGTPPAVEAAGSGMGSLPHGWMAGDTHFRPWFNVDGCYPAIGYGAAQSASKKWYYAAVPHIDRECKPHEPQAPQPAQTADQNRTDETAGTRKGAQSGPLSFEAAYLNNFYIRHGGFVGYISEINTDTDKKDATFIKQKGLSDPEYLSFTSQNFPDHYLVIENDKLVVRKFADSEDFRKQATFMITESLADPTLSSIQLVSEPEKYLRHKDYLLVLEKPDGSELFKKDSSFKFAVPRWIEN
jgi:hypothetical protein